MTSFILKEVKGLNYQNEVHFTPMKAYSPYHSPYDPCPPLKIKYYSTPPQLYMHFQPPNLEQFPPHEALMRGTLWKPLYDYYDNPYKKGTHGHG